MQGVLITFEGTEQNVHDLISNVPQMVTNVGATFVDATRVDMDAPVTADGEEAPAEVTGSQPEEPKPDFLGEPSEAEKTMEKE